MKKLFALVIVVLFFFTSSASHDASAASKKKGKGGVTEEQLTQIVADIQRLRKKIYAHGLFSPQDNQTLISIKMTLDDVMLTAPDPTFAPLYFNLGIICEQRMLKDDAVECFQTILENFGDTALGPKARNELTKMGVTIKAPGMPGDAAGGATPVEDMQYKNEVQYLL